MFRKLITVLALLVIFQPVASAQQSHQPYAGRERREIKALAPEEVEALMTGQGMGFAMAAELNHYPGPRHALDLAAQLGLSERQRAETRRVFERMKAEAVRTGAEIVGKERELDGLFARGEIDAPRLRALSREIALLRGDLRAAHLQAHLEMKRILTPEQVKKYDELRGYNPPGGANTHGPSRHGKH